MRVPRNIKQIDLTKGPGTTELLDQQLRYLDSLAEQRLGGVTAMEFDGTDDIGERVIVSLKLDGVMHPEYMEGRGRRLGYTFNAMMGNQPVTVEYWLKEPLDGLGRGFVRDRDYVPELAASAPRH